MVAEFKRWNKYTTLDKNHYTGEDNIDIDSYIYQIPIQFNRRCNTWPFFCGHLKCTMRNGWFFLFTELSKRGKSVMPKWWISKRKFHVWGGVFFFSCFSSVLKFWLILSLSPDSHSIKSIMKGSGKFARKNHMAPHGAEFFDICKLWSFDDC